MTEPPETGLPADLEQVAEALGDALAPNGFCLLVFPLGTPSGRYFYTSNAERGDVVEMLRDFLAAQQEETVNGRG
jgi:hypothetical protein